MRERSRPRSGRLDAVRRVLQQRLGTTSEGLRNRLGATSRGTSTTLNYILLLGIVSILVTALVAGFGGLVDGQQDRAVRSQLEVVGNRVAGDVGQVDTLARHDGDVSTVAVRVDLPARVVGRLYTLTVTQQGADPQSYRLTLATEDSSVMVTVPFRSATEVTVAGGTVHGGPLIIRYDGTTVVIDGD